MRGIKPKNPMQTRHGRTRYKSFSVTQLEDMYSKASNPKSKHKIRQELDRKINHAT